VFEYVLVCFLPDAGLENTMLQCLCSVFSAGIGSGVDLEHVIGLPCSRTLSAWLKVDQPFAHEMFHEWQCKDKMQPAVRSHMCSR
jgi:hypothetical protein